MGEKTGVGFALRKILYSAFALIHARLLPRPARECQSV